MQIILPMAGKGSRFLDKAGSNPEYIKPKPLISIKNKPMVSWALESLKDFDIKPKDLIFICRKDHDDEFQISKKLKEIFGHDIKIILLDYITRGAAETVLKAKELINLEEEIIIMDCDIFFSAKPLYQQIKTNKDAAGILPVFKPKDIEPKWSYALFDPQTNVVSEVGEKDPALASKGAYAILGSYYFSKSRIFIEEAEEMIKSSEMYGTQGKKEFYIAPLYNRLIKKGSQIKVALIDNFWGLGTPDDVDNFLKNYPK
jgi:dTDP-glucose pyrophosphorylase